MQFFFSYKKWSFLNTLFCPLLFSANGPPARPFQPVHRASGFSAHWISVYTVTAFESPSGYPWFKCPFLSWRYLGAGRTHASSCFCDHLCRENAQQWQGESPRGSANLGKFGRHNQLLADLLGQRKKASRCFSFCISLRREICISFAAIFSSGFLIGISLLVLVVSLLVFPYLSVGTLYC